MSNNIANLFVRLKLKQIMIILIACTITINLILQSLHLYSIFTMPAITTFFRGSKYRNVGFIRGLKIPKNIICSKGKYNWSGTFLRFFSPHVTARHIFKVKDFINYVKQRQHNLNKRVLSLQIPIVIQDGEIYLLHANHALSAKSGKETKRDKAYIHKWLMTMIDTLHSVSLATRLPNAYFILDASDYPMGVLRTTIPNILRFSASGDIKQWNIPVPSGQFNRNYQKFFETWSRHNVYKNMYHFQQPIIPFEKRKTRGVWRGSYACHDSQDCSSCSRVAAVRASLNNPTILSARFIDHFTNLETSQDRCRKQHFKDYKINLMNNSGPMNALTMDQFSTYKFVVALKGTSYNHICKYLYLLNSIVLKEHNHRYHEYFDSSTQDWVHHIPFHCHEFDQCDLIKLIRSAQQAEKNKTFPITWHSVANEGFKWARIHLHPIGHACYWYSLLLRTQALLTNDGFNETIEKRTFSTTFLKINGIKVINFETLLEYFEPINL